MAWIVCCIISVYFLIGAVAIFFINKKSIDTKDKRNRWLKYLIYFVIVNTVIWTLFYGVGFIWISAIIVLLGFYELIKVWKASPKKKSIVLLLGLSVFSILGFGFIQYVLLPYEYGQKVLVYILVFTFDGFSQIIGQLIGKRKLSPKVSPNKTIEGLIGGFIFAIITMVFIEYCIFDIVTSITSLVRFSLIMCSGALIGDLAASYYKRLCKVKDYSNIIPGHGGVLDRFDSFIVAGFVYWVLEQSL